MSEGYEIVGKEIQYTNSEYPGFSVRSRKYKSEEVSKRRAKQKFNEIIGCRNHTFNSNVVDKVWLNGSHARTDYNINSTEGQRIKGILDTNFSTLTYDTNDLNLISEFTPTRPPYINNSISWYDIQEVPGSLKTSYGCSYEKYCSWYGLKFDLTTNNVLLKVVVSADDELAKSMTSSATLPLSKFPVSTDFCYFAFIHDLEGNINENADFYIYTSDIHIKEFCTVNDLAFPYNYSDTEVRDRIWCWGIVFNRLTGVPTHVKAYERTFV